jgi:hypothetical protein
MGSVIGDFPEQCESRRHPGPTARMLGSRTIVHRDNNQDWSIEPTRVDILRSEQVAFALVSFFLFHFSFFLWLDLMQIFLFIDFLFS